MLRLMGLLLAASMCVTEGLLLMQGRWREAIPLHLCSISALLAFAAAFGMRGDGLDFLWYLGLPGALLALLFPAPAVSEYQVLLNASYFTTHLLIVLIPLVIMRLDDWPRPGRAARMMLILQGIAIAAFVVNHALDTDFLFLMAPPAGTPLETVYAWGYPAYLLTLEGTMLALCLFQSALVRALLKLRGKHHAF